MSKKSLVKRLESPIDIKDIEVTIKIDKDTEYVIHPCEMDIKVDMDSFTFNGVAVRGGWRAKFKNVKGFLKGKAKKR